MQGRGQGNVATERLCGALFVGLTTLKGYFYINLGGTHTAKKRSKTGPSTAAMPRDSEQPRESGYER